MPDANTVRSKLEERLILYENARLGLLGDGNPDTVSIPTYKDMRLDPAAYLALGYIKAPVKSVSWTVDCDQDVIKDFLNETFIEPLLSDLLDKGLLDLDYGYSVVKKYYKLGMWSGKQMVIPYEYINPDPVDVTIQRDEDGYAGFTFKGKVFYPAEVTALFNHNVESGNLYGTSALQPSYRSWYNLDILRMLCNRSYEIHGGGIRTVRFPPELNPPNDAGEQTLKYKGEALDLARDLKSNSYAAIPALYDAEGNEMWEIRTEFGEANGPSWIDILEFYQREVMRGVLIPDAALTRPSVDVGTLAEAEGRIGIYGYRLDEEIERKAFIINKHIIQQLVEINFGEGIPCKIVPSPIADQEKDRFYDMLNELAGYSDLDARLNELVTDKIFDLVGADVKDYDKKVAERAKKEPVTEGE